ncbi:MAG: hypothetical protein K2W95_12265 [Candidatus Obscuribacterales bacterium]|nr:hypothetical protein [Candidatus Obscuribacterales bacterium]
MPSVVIHKYRKGADGHAFAKPHLKYIRYRPGRESEPRNFFDGANDCVDRAEIERRLASVPTTGVVLHTLMLSPGQNTNIKNYVRNVMEKIQNRKCQDFFWYAVEHNHTDHQHAHVVVLGLDRQNRQVRFNKQDYCLMRLTGDRYLKRDRSRQRRSKLPRHRVWTYHRDFNWEYEARTIPKRLVCSRAKKHLEHYRRKTISRVTTSSRIRGDSDPLYWLQPALKRAARENEKTMEQGVAMTVRGCAERQRKDLDEQTWER